MMCFRCGLILNDQEDKPHICNPSDIPIKGKAKKPTTTTIDTVE